jgi:ABC-type spermidine/putrescine transport system permease subunit II
MRILSTLLWRGYAALVIIFMLSPLVFLIVFSFGESPLSTFPMGGLSLRWYEALFERASFWQAFQNSLVVTGTVGVTSTVVGSMAALALGRMRERAAVSVAMFLSFPIMLPPLVIALALLSFYVKVGLDLTLFTVILSHLLFTQPFVILIVYARMAGFDYTLIASARDLGAPPWRVFTTITLPIIRPTVIGAGLIAMAISLDDFIITFFTIGGGNTVPTLIWGMLRLGVTPTINAAGTLLIMLTISAAVIALRLTRYRG